MQPNTPPPFMFEHCLYFNVNAFSRKLNARQADAFSELDLTPSHACLLRLVLDEPGLTQQEISDKLRLNKSTTARFISALEAKKLIQRKPSSKDRRERTIVPSNIALQLHEPLKAVGNELYTDLCKVIGRDHLESFMQTIRTINEKL